MKSGLSKLGPSKEQQEENEQTNQIQEEEDKPEDEKLEVKEEDKTPADDK